MQFSVKTTQKDEVVDITDAVERLLAREKRNSEGLCVVFVQHTTCALTTADLDPGTDEDLLEALRKLLPKIKYRHPHDPSHTPDHILSSIIGPSVTVPFSGGKLQLGTWQRIVLVELNGPRMRNVSVRII